MRIAYGESKSKKNEMLFTKVFTIFCYHFLAGARVLSRASLNRTSLYAYRTSIYYLKMFHNLAPESLKNRNPSHLLI